MEQYGAGGSWAMIPNIQSHSNPPTPSNQDPSSFLLHPQQQQQQQQLFNQIQPPQPPQQQPQQQQQQQPPPPQQQQQRYQQTQSLASHFNLSHLVENLADVIENGTRDQHSDALVAELNNQFEKCQQLLNSIAGKISSKSMTVEGQKQKVKENENLLNQRRDLISKYKNSVEELINSEP